MPDEPRAAAANPFGSLRAAWACRSWFCRKRGPFATKTLEKAELMAQDHRRQKWLGVFQHDAIFYPLDEEQSASGRGLVEKPFGIPPSEWDFSVRLPNTRGRGGDGAGPPVF